MIKFSNHSEILELSNQLNYTQALKFIWDLFYDNSFDDLLEIVRIIEFYPNTFNLLTQSQKKYILIKSCKFSMFDLPYINPYNFNCFFSIPDKYKSEANYIRIFMVLRYMNASPFKFSLCKKLLKNIKHNRYLSVKLKKRFAEDFNTIIMMDLKK